MTLLLIIKFASLVQRYRVGGGRPGKLLRRMMSGRHWEAWHFQWTAVLNMHRAISHASQCLPDIIPRRSFTRPSTTIAVIEGLGMRLDQSSLVPIYPVHVSRKETFLLVRRWDLGTRLGPKYTESNLIHRALYFVPVFHSLIIKQNYYKQVKKHIIVITDREIAPYE